MVAEPFLRRPCAARAPMSLQCRRPKGNNPPEENEQFSGRKLRSICLLPPPDLRPRESDLPSPDDRTRSNGPARVNRDEPWQTESGGGRSQEVAEDADTPLTKCDSET